MTETVLYETDDWCKFVDEIDFIRKNSKVFLTEPNEHNHTFDFKFHIGLSSWVIKDHEKSYRCGPEHTKYIYKNFELKNSNPFKLYIHLPELTFWISLCKMRTIYKIYIGVDDESCYNTMTQLLLCIDDLKRVLCIESNE